MHDASISYYCKHNSKCHPGISMSNPKCFKHNIRSTCDLDQWHVIPKLLNRSYKATARATELQAQDENDNRSSRYINTNVGTNTHNTG